MNIKADIQLYINGNRAAEMRLIAFVLECEKRLDIGSLMPLTQINGRIRLIALRTIENIKRQINKSMKQQQAKNRLRRCLSAIESTGFFEDPSGSRAVWLPLLKEIEILRWKIQPDQEMYNIDLRIRIMLDIARRIGVYL